jgi:anaerobic ribonucleoside-triphosphate reductase activating protein
MELSKKNPLIIEFLKNIDVLVDGRFVLAERSYEAKFRGSKNQRVIDVKKSLRQNRVITIKKYDLPKPIKVVTPEQLGLFV